MAIRSNNGNQFTTPFGETITNVYGVFDRFSNYDKKRLLAEGTLDLYTSKQARNDGHQPFQRIYIAISNSDFTDNLTTKGNTRHNDIAAGVYSWLAAIPPIINGDGVVIFDPAEWHSDES